MRRALLTFAAVAAVAILVAGAPSMAADNPPDTAGSTMNSGDSGPVQLEFEDRPRHGHREKPRQKGWAPGRENPNGLEAACTNNGFLGEVFGLVGIVRTCPAESDSRLGFRFW